jgi:hypothetical protein
MNHFSTDTKSVNTAIPQVPNGTTTPTRHSDYYFEDRNLVIQVSTIRRPCTPMILTLYPMSSGQHSPGIRGCSKTSSHCQGPNVFPTKTSKDHQMLSLCIFLGYRALNLSICYGYCIPSQYMPFTLSVSSKVAACAFQNIWYAQSKDCRRMDFDPLSGN